MSIGLQQWAHGSDQCALDLQITATSLRLETVDSGSGTLPPRLKQAREQSPLDPSLDAQKTCTHEGNFRLKSRLASQLQSISVSGPRRITLTQADLAQIPEMDLFEKEAVDWPAVRLQIP